MSIHKSYRGTGLSHKLMNQVVVHASKLIFKNSAQAKCIVVSVTQMNHRAVKFYKKMGFKMLTVRRNVIFGVFQFSCWHAALCLPSVWCNQIQIWVNSLPKVYENINRTEETSSISKKLVNCSRYYLFSTRNSSLYYGDQI